MRTWILAGLVLTFALMTAGQGIAQTKGGQPASCTLKITGMTCGGCEGAVKMAAKSVNGVKSVTASYETGKATVTYDPSKTSPEAIAKVVTDKSGFKAEVIREPAKK